MRCFLNAAAFVAATAIAACTGSVVAAGDLSAMSVDDVQDLLTEHNLSPFFGETFQKYLVDGPVLQTLRKSDFSETAFPNAQEFHWRKFWAVLSDLRSPSTRRVLANGAVEEGRQRSLADSSGLAGIQIAKENAALMMGVDSDVVLRRTDESELTVEGRLLVGASDGSTLDVASTLEDLLDNAGSSDNSCDERFDALVDMVALNTKLLMNVSVDCAAAAANTEIEVYGCQDTYDRGENSGIFETVDGVTVRCNNDLSVGGWTLALNIDTDDGNVVDYTNKAFWENGITLGGATANAADGLTNDYKNSEIFDNMAVGQILVVVHDEGNTLGWRAWDMANTTKPLSYYFSGAGEDINVCGASDDDTRAMDVDAYIPMTLRSFDADIGDLVDMEPIVYMDDCQLLANVDVAGTNDFNRLSCAQHAYMDASNLGWGLGTIYDAGHDIDGNSGDPICPQNTKRPLCDAQLHTTHTAWGSSGGTGGMIGTDNICNDGCPWTIESGLDYDYAIYVKESPQIAYDSCEDALNQGAATGGYLLTTGEWVYCNNDLSLGGWTLALNIDTSDGNVVDYGNEDFWESTTELGGAQSYSLAPFVHDYKNLNVFGSFPATEILVVLHTEGTEVLGYRAWSLVTEGQPLADYFGNGAANQCGNSELETGSFNYVTNRVIDSYVGDDVIEEEPLIYHDDYQLYSNIETGESNDYNRLTAKDHPEITDNSGNYGWGLGTLYDATHSSSGSAVCPSDSARPQCDAQLHTTIGAWGSGGGIGGMIGSDNICNDDCPWTIPSNLDWDYAIYVRATEPTYYDSCTDVAAAGEASGQYMLSNNEHVYCYVDDNGDGWMLALNIHTSDGNVVHYSNVDFWESSSELGGATNHHATPFRQDYKNTYAFAEYDASEVMIYVHDNTVGAQDSSLGWRSWYTASTQPLVNYFTGNNACGSGVSSLSESSYAMMTDGVIDGAIHDLIANEPIVYSAYDLYANTETGDSHDFNRLSGQASASDKSSNLGYGLGTLYDATHTDSDEACGPNGAQTARPQCDGQFRVEIGAWGSGGGLGGMIGTDNVCVSDCPWTVESGYFYNYAIFVH